MTYTTMCSRGHSDGYPSGQQQASKDGPIVVTYDWPVQVPIGDAELRVLEGHLRDELDALFGPLAVN